MLMAVTFTVAQKPANPRERISINEDWRFLKYASPQDADSLIYDVRPFAAGEFVWNGFDYLGEPTPCYEARSSYTGIIDLAGFRKDRFYLYQAHWRPDLAMAHILPHWNWPDRIGQVTPVHVFTSGDEAELFLNEKPRTHTVCVGMMWSTNPAN